MAALHHLISHRPASAVPVALMCAVLALPLTAQAKSYKPAGASGSPGAGAVNHSATTSRSQPSPAPSARPTGPSVARSTPSAIPSRSSTDPSARPSWSSTTPRSSTSYRPGSPSTTYSSDTRTGGTSYRVGTPGATSPSVRSSDSRIYYRPDTGSQDRSGSRTEYRAGPTPQYKPSVEASRGPERAPERRYEPSHSAPRPAPTRTSPSYSNPKPEYHAGSVTHNVVTKTYKPPVYRSGRYYYEAPHVHRPCYYGYWAFDYVPSYSRRSCYFHFGIFPYVNVTRVVVSSYPKVIYVGEPIYTSSGYYLESAKYAALDEALADIRSAWIAGRYDLIANHIRSYDSIAVFDDGSYDYSINGQDYLDMTRDAVEDLQTASFVWDGVRQRSDGSVTAFATHKYYDGSGYIKTVYVSYTMQRIGSGYYVTEVGSSLNPLY